MTDANKDEGRDDRVSRRAYELWEQEGGEHGRHEDHWHRAASEVDEQVSVAAPDGTTLSVPADEVEGEAPKPAARRAATKAKATPGAAPAKAPDKTAPKPRKPKAKAK